MWLYWEIRKILPRLVTTVIYLLFTAKVAHFCEFYLQYD